MRHALETKHAITQYGDGPVTLLFVHGLGCNQAVWRYMAPAFSDRCRIVLMDLVGCGAADDSAWTPERYATLDGHAEDVLEVAQHLSDTQTILVVHSVACMIGLLADLKAPHLFDAHAMVSPSPCYRNLPGYRGGFEVHEIAALLDALDADQAAWAARMALLLSGQGADAPLSRELVGMLSRARHEPLRAFVRATFHGDYREQLGALVKPALVMQCDKDAVAPLDVGRSMARTMRDARLEIIRAAGHFPQLTHPRKSIQLLDRYLAGLGLGSMSRWPPLVPRI